MVCLGLPAMCGSDPVQGWHGAGVATVLCMSYGWMSGKHHSNREQHMVALLGSAPSNGAVVARDACNTNRCVISQLMRRLCFALKSGSEGCAAIGRHPCSLHLAGVRKPKLAGCPPSCTIGQVRQAKCWRQVPVHAWTGIQ